MAGTDWFFEMILINWRESVFSCTLIVFFVNVFVEEFWFFFCVVVWLFSIDNFGAI